jgi:hypothetical protein
VTTRFEQDGVEIIQESADATCVLLKYDMWLEVMSKVVSSYMCQRRKTTSVSITESSGEADSTCIIDEDQKYQVYDPIWWTASKL